MIRQYTQDPKWDSVAPIHGYTAIRAGEVLLLQNEINMFVQFFPTGSTDENYLLFLQIVMDDQSDIR